MSTPDFDQMTKDEVIAWFKTSDDLTPALGPMRPATDTTRRPLPEVPMVLASIRLPVTLLEQLDSLADLQRVRRSDVVREALTAYVTERTAPIGRDEAERALDVLRRVIASRTGRSEAA